METIIAQKYAELFKKIVNHVNEHGISSIGATAEDLLEFLKEGTREILSSFIQMMDEAILQAKKDRTLDGLSVKARNVERVCITALGAIRYVRTYYQCSDGTKFCPVDLLIGVEPYERVDKEVCAKMVELVADCSMAKAAKALGCEVSRQTVNNKLLAMEDVVTDVSRQDETPEELHIFADEDHVHLRPKRSAIVPLVTVTEGIDTSDANRHKTVNPIHFQGCAVNNDAFTENVVSAIYERYDVDRIRNIYIHADGGRWIGRLGELLPNSVFVMDGFHAEKQLKALIGLKGAKPYAGALRQALKKDDRESFMKYCESILQHQDDDDSQEKLLKLTGYFYNNWKAIAERYSGRHCGSCTEPLVGHILSERLSRNPLAWSPEGAAKMAMLRVYVKNGNKVKAEHIRVSRSRADRKRDFEARREGLEKYNRYAEKQINEFFSNKFDWSIFDSPSKLAGLTDGKLTGTAVLLNTYSHFSSIGS